MLITKILLVTKIKANILEQIDYTDSELVPRNFLAYQNFKISMCTWLGRPCLILITLLINLQLLPLDTLLARNGQSYPEVPSSHLSLGTHVENETVQINHSLLIPFLSSFNINSHTGQLLPRQMTLYKIKLWVVSCDFNPWVKLWQLSELYRSP